MTVTYSRMLCVRSLWFFHCQRRLTEWKYDLLELYHRTFLTWYPKIFFKGTALESTLLGFSTEKRHMLYIQDNHCISYDDIYCQSLSTNWMTQIQLLNGQAHFRCLSTQSHVIRRFKTASCPFSVFLRRQFPYQECKKPRLSLIQAYQESELWDSGLCRMIHLSDLHLVALASINVSKSDCD